MPSKKQIFFIIIFGVILIGGLIYFNRKQIVDTALPLAFKPTETNLPQLDKLPESTEEIVAENLKVPWEIAFLPDNSMLVTERPGTLKHITSNSTAITVEGVSHRGEGGLMGLALHPNFKENNFIYLYSTTATSGGLTNRVERYIYKDEKLSDRKAILENIPGANNHDGGRIAFGPDGMLYIATGDAEISSNAQDKNSLAGKILRLKDDGSIPSDNPFNNATYSYGHRNPQGIAWDSNGQLWSTEHGPSGTQTGNDELNKIEKGGNYGWPTIKGSQIQSGLITPTLESGNDDTWAPAGLAFYRGLLIFSGLRGESIYSTQVTNGQLGPLTNYLRKKYGRIRAIVSGPDDALYITTSNTDGRGKAKAGDDKIIKIRF